MVSALLKLREASNAFSPTEQGVAQQILEHPEMVEQLSIHELARRTFVSPSTIVRMCNHAGFSGYKGFRKAVTSELVLRENSVSPEEKKLQESSSLEEIAETVTYRNILSLEQSKNLLEIESLRRCVEMIREARILYLFGMGASLCAAQDAYFKFLRLNRPCFVNDDWHSQLMTSRNAGADDLGIVFSYSGHTEEMIECMKAMKANGTRMIAITRCVQSPVSELATERLYTTANETIFRSGPSSSRIAQQNIVDILCAALAMDGRETSVLMPPDFDASKM